MQPKVCIFSFGRMSKLIAQQVKSLDLPVKFKIHDFVLDKAVQLAKEMKDVDVFLSSGYNAQILKQQVDIPVITIDISIYDILLVLSEASKYDETPLIISYERNYSELQNITDLLNIKILQDYYTSIDDLCCKIRTYKNKGTKCVIGSSLVCDAAEENGMKGILVYPQESIRKYLHVAADLAISIRKEINKNKQLTAIMEYSEQGILFTDDKGTVFLCNPVAEKILEVKAADLIGQLINCKFPEIELNDVISSKQVELNQIYKINNKQVVMNKIPIVYKGEASNILLTFNDIKAIQKAEHKIRENLIQKGFVAKYNFQDLSSASPKFQRVVSQARRFSQSDEIIVILGETGSGKEVLAQSIHNYSRRAKNAFVAVNCSAISENLLESELFGYEEGAFTGARKGGKEGLFEMAHGGTIFLDEIGEIHPSLQPKLLRVIQNKEVMRVGGSKMTPIDTRIIAATNKNLWELVQEKQFREDLYYRINVLELNIPPLRERKEDIYPLFMKFVELLVPQWVEKLGGYRDKLEELLSSYNWPGNVRELENYTKKLVASMESNSTPNDIYDLVVEDLFKKKQRLDAYSVAINEEMDMTDTAQLYYINQEKKKINEALAKARGNQSEAARLLGISRVTLWRKLKQFNLK